MTDDPEEYRSRLYDRYVTEFTGDRPDDLGTPTLKADLLRFVPTARDANILDAGCGNGVLLRVLKENGYRRLTGVDLSEEQVESARRLGTSEVERGDVLTHLTANRGSYDCILLVDVLEHFEKSDLLPLAEAASGALKEGGVLIVRTPNAETPYSGRLRYGDLTHGVAFTHHSIAQLLAAAGFSRTEVHGTSPAIHGMPSLIRFLLWKVIETTRKLTIAVETGVLRGHVTSQNLVAVAWR